MTPDEKQQYLEHLRSYHGKLTGADSMLWKTIVETEAAIRSGRSQLATARQQVAELEKMLLQLVGRHQCAVDTLCQLEQTRRDAELLEEEVEAEPLEAVQAGAGPVPATMQPHPIESDPAVTR